MNDVPTKYIKKFSNVFIPVITNNYSNCTVIGIFPECFKTEVIPTYKKDKTTEKKLTTGQLVYFPIYLKFMTDLYRLYEKLMTIAGFLPLL